MKKLLCALSVKWWPMLTTIVEANNLADLPFEVLIGNHKVYEMILESDKVVSKDKKEKVKSLSLKANSLGNKLVMIVIVKKEVVKTKKKMMKISTLWKETLESSLDEVVTLGAVIGLVTVVIEIVAIRLEEVVVLIIRLVKAQSLNTGAITTATRITS